MPVKTHPKTPFPFAEAKLGVPSVPRGVLERPRIRTVLDATGDAALTLVAAPAGYGKTTAVRAWCAKLDGPVVWVTLDEVDNDPVRMWRYVATAVDRVREGLGRGALHCLTQSGAVVDAVDELLNGAAAYGDRIVIVLDDLHTVRNDECLDSLDYAVAGLPANVSLIAITRVDPSLRLARMRASGTLLELRATELAFTPAEAYELLVLGGQLEIGREEVRALTQATEGWPAALVLAGIWLRSHSDPRRAVSDFHGDHHFVAEYLANEVIAALDGDSRSFLLGAAVIGQFTAELLNAVLGRTDSAARLAEFERANLFIVRLERGGWYRVHSLFAEYARAHLRSESPAAATDIDRRAALWLRERGLPVEAIGHAVAAGDHDLAAEIISEHDLMLVRGGASRTLLYWVRALPDTTIAAHPELAGSAALAALLVGGERLEHRRFVRIFAEAERANRHPSTPLAEAQVLVAQGLAFDGGVAQALHHAQKAVELAETGVEEATSGALVAYARALYFAGDLEAAASVALRALADPVILERTPSLVHAHATLVFVALERGRIVAAREHADRAKAAVGSIHSTRSWLGANASAALGMVLAAEGHLPAAERELVRSEHLFSDEVPTFHRAWILVALARVRVRRGHLDDAESALRAAQDALASFPDIGRIGPAAAEVEQELATERARARGGEVLAPPTEAELAVLRLLATDLSMAEIGEQLYLSLNTIRSHTRALFRKLGVHSRADLVARALALGLLEQVESPG